MCSLLPPFFGEMKLPAPEGLEELELRKLNNNEIQFFFFSFTLNFLRIQTKIIYIISL